MGIARKGMYKTQPGEDAIGKRCCDKTSASQKEGNIGQNRMVKGTETRARIERMHRKRRITAAKT